LIEWIRTVFDTLAKPKPAADGAKDPRTAPQRRHDGLLEALKLTARADLLPDCGGITSTLLVTMTRDAFLTGEGTATTGSGGPPANEGEAGGGGQPHWIPPAWTGDQTPIRNTAHDPRPQHPLRT